MPSTKKLPDLIFPIFKMGAVERIYTNSLGLVMVETHRGEFVLDDTNMIERNYALRRIVLKREGYPVYHLNKKLSTFSQVIQYPSGTYFIDSTGYVITYRKSNKYHKLRSRAILTRSYDPAFGSIIYVEGLPYPFLYKERIPTTYKYAGVLEVEGGGLLYNITRKPFKDTRRKI